MLSLDSVRTVVLDEADRMLDMGFIRDIEKILHRIPTDRQTLLFSATISEEIERLARKFLRDPKNVKMASTVKPELLRQTYYQTSPDQKQALLVHLLKSERELALVFCNRKHITKRLADRLAKEGILARCLNGNMSQPQREKATNDFRHRRFNVLVATDVAARGLDIEGISHVYNYEIPRDVESYTHRVGRTARAGKHGQAISLVAGGEEQDFFKQILFTYKGVIALKTAADVRPLVKAQQPNNGGRQSAAPAQHHHAERRGEKQGNRQEQERGKNPTEHRKRNKRRPWENMHREEKGWSNHPARRRVN
jgi:ATP-dependent RNA helicase DeaD